MSRLSDLFFSGAGFFGVHSALSGAGDGSVFGILSLYFISSMVIAFMRREYSCGSPQAAASAIILCCILTVR